MSRTRRLRIAMVTSVLARFDAISNDVVRTAGFLRDTPGWDVSVFAGHNERDDVSAIVPPRLSDLLLAPQFLQADVIIYHFGIYYPLFDAILLGNGRAHQAVIFHNITPPQFVESSARHVIAKSFAQLSNLHAADAIWADSRENLEMLIEQGFEAEKITIQPLAVDRPPRRRVWKSPGDAIEILFVGRMVPAKGVQDLVEALAQLDVGNLRVRVRLIGNIEHADARFRAGLYARIAELGLSDRVQFVGMVSDEERDSLLHAGHILAVPSYHEGFCVPVIEALRAGMLPVVYSAHNLRYIAGGLCVSSPPGDVAAFASALNTAIVDVNALLRNPSTATIRLDRCAMTVDEFEDAISVHVSQFEPTTVAQKLRDLVAGLVARGGITGARRLDHQVVF